MNIILVQIRDMKECKVMKRAAAFLFVLCMFVSLSSAVASEITEEHFPGYYVELHSNTKELSEMAKTADWSLVESEMPPGSQNNFHRFYVVKYPSTGSVSTGRAKEYCFSYKGRNAKFYVMTRSKKSLRNYSVPIAGTRFVINYIKPDESFETDLNENQEWLEDHFGSSSVKKDQYLLMLNNDLVEVSVYEQKNDRNIVFDMFLVEDSDQALETYGYQSLDDVPIAPWTPMGIPAEE